MRRRAFFEAAVLLALFGAVLAVAHSSPMQSSDRITTVTPSIYATADIATDDEIAIRYCSLSFEPPPQ